MKRNNKQELVKMLGDARSRRATVIFAPQDTRRKQYRELEEEINHAFWADLEKALALGIKHVGVRANLKVGQIMDLLTSGNTYGPRPRLVHVGGGTAAPLARRLRALKRRMEVCEGKARKMYALHDRLAAELAMTEGAVPVKLRAEVLKFIEGK